MKAICIYLLLIVLIAILICCNRKKENLIETATSRADTIFSKNKQFYYNVIFFNADSSIAHYDTVILKSYGNTWPSDPIQKKISWIYFTGNTYYQETTGVIENKDQVWIHPPRYSNFKILEMSPFPMVKIPLMLGN